MTEKEETTSKEEILDIYQKLEDSFNISHNSDLENLVNFEGSRETSLHRWYDYAEGFSPQLVEDKINSMENVDFVFDPFLGSGTTCLKSAEMGMNSLGIEINPFTADLAKVKTRNYSEQDLDKFKEKIKEMKNIEFETSIDYPELSFAERMFKDKDGTNHLDEVLMYREFIEGVEDDKIRNLLKVGWLSVLEEVSNYKKGGNGLKKDYNPDRDLEKSLFEEQYPMMVQDIQTRLMYGMYENYKTPVVKHGNSFDLEKFLDDESIDVSVFSPPYANCFDYFEIYKIELWIGGYVESYEELREKKREAVRSHVNLKMDYSDVEDTPEELTSLIEAIDESELWNSNIPDMLRGYFFDMRTVLEKMYEKMRDEGEIHIVVSNSSYGNVVIPTDLIIAKIADNLNYEVQEITVARKMVTSSQQYTELGDMNDYMRESIISIRKG